MSNGCATESNESQVGWLGLWLAAAPCARRDCGLENVEWRQFQSFANVGFGVADSSTSRRHRYTWNAIGIVRS